MRLHVLYRSYGGENQKGRPPYYNKRLSLVSFLRSLENAPEMDVTFINNGPIPADRLELMQSSGARILQIDKPGMRPSYRFALNHAMESDWADDDVVYLCEDDYLHVPEALTRLDRAVREMPEVSYFLTYGSTWTHPIVSQEHLDEIRPKGWRPGVATTVDGQTWRPAFAATSTYAVRVGALRQDYGIILQGHLPFRNRYLDLEMGLVWQGYEPYRWGDIGREAVGLAKGGARQKLRGIGEAPFKVAFNLRSHRRPGRRRFLYVAEPNLATHLESAFLAPGRDWAVLAAETQQWFEDGGLGLQEDLLAQEKATA
jgi:glycosyltransferase involved in cell wall biosynthesis